MVFGADVLDLDFWVQVDSIEQPIKRNSVGSGNVSLCTAYSLYHHLDNCFVVLKHIQQLPDEKSSRARADNQHCPNISVGSLRTVALGELLLGQGHCEGLDLSLQEVAVLGLVTCVGVGFVRGTHLLVGGVHSVTTNPRGSIRAVGGRDECKHADP